MTSILDKKTFFVKEHVGYFKAANAYDCLDPQGGELITQVQESIPNFFVKMMKFTSYKKMMPFTVEFKDKAGNVFMRLKRPFTFFRSRVSLEDANGTPVGSFQQKLLSLGGKFEVFDAANQPVGMLTGDWKGWDFSFKNSQEQVLAKVTKKWAGLGKELFTSADNYIVNLERDDLDEKTKKLIAGAAICIDMVLKEQGR
ncbi:MAG: RNAase [Planctomycetes bacterium]|nr:RNAase [Planctomycetota bacterium]